MNNQVTQLPSSYFGKADKYIADISSRFEKSLKKTEWQYQFDDLKLDQQERKVVATLLVDMFEDIRHEKNLWGILETQHQKLFELQIPVLLEKNEVIEDPEMIHLIRIQYFLWILFSEMRPGFILSAVHPDLLRLAKRSYEFLSEAFEKVPSDSGVHKFLFSAPQNFRQLKEKLVWLGMHSYVFRVSFDRYLSENQGVDEEGKIKINVADDFMTWVPGCWSGLSVNEVLAGLEKDDKRKAEITDWKYKHTAWYLVDRVDESLVIAQNVINGESYQIESGDFAQRYNQGNVVFSSLVKWNEAWHWTGEQQMYETLGPDEIIQLRNTFITQFYSLACNYTPMLAENAKKSAKGTYEKFVEHFQTDLLVVSSGKELKEKLQGFELVADVMNFPDSLLESDNGIALYMNPDEGYEIAINFNTVISALDKKEGELLNESEEDALRGFMLSKELSVNFIHKLQDFYGSRGFLSAFLLPGMDDKLNLEFLLHRFKGEFQRTRYPKMIFQTPANA